jgi:hypothetical protein
LAKSQLQYPISQLCFASLERNLNFEFIKKPIPVLNKVGGAFELTDSFNTMALNPTFKQFLLDALAYGIHAFQKRFKATGFHHGFVLVENIVAKMFAEF